MPNSVSPARETEIGNWFSPIVSISANGLMAQSWTACYRMDIQRISRFVPLPTCGYAETGRTRSIDIGHFAHRLFDDFDKFIGCHPFPLPTDRGS